MVYQPQRCRSLAFPEYIHVCAMANINQTPLQNRLAKEPARHSHSGSDPASEHAVKPFETVPQLMQGVGWRKVWMRKIQGVVWLGLMGLSPLAGATAEWLPQQPDEVFVPLVSFDGSRYLDARLRFDSLLGFASQPSSERLNSLDQTAQQLTIREVEVDGQTYWDVLVRPAALLSLGGVSQRSTRQVKVVGDSLSDAGTFGYKFTVQGTTGAPTQIWTDKISASLAAPPLCARYLATTATQAELNPDPSFQTCTSLAVGGGRIHPLGVLGQSFRDTPFSITRQLRDMATLHPYAADDVLLLTAGGNDAADLMTLFMDSSTEGVLKFALYLNEMLTTEQVLKATAGGSSARAQAGHQLMTALANRLADHMVAHIWDQGAQRVVVLNVPNVTRTPRFQATLSRRSDSADLERLGGEWADTFNARLLERMASVSDRMLVVDFKALLDRWVTEPLSFGLTNGSAPACPVTSVDSQGVPDYELKSCSAANAQAGWQGHVFADGFHGTPAVQRLVAREVLQHMLTRGWR